MHAKSSKPTPGITIKKKVLITDLDNTLYDWVEIWFQSFSAMLDAILSLTGFDAIELKKEIRQVHRKHGTSEYAFVLQEVPPLKSFARDQPVEKVFNSAITAFRQARSENLHLYPTVRNTLELLKDVGRLCEPSTSYRHSLHRLLASEHIPV